MRCSVHVTLAFVENDHWRVFDKKNVCINKCMEVDLDIIPTDVPPYSHILHEREALLDTVRRSQSKIQSTARDTSTPVRSTSGHLFATLGFFPVYAAFFILVVGLAVPLVQSIMPSS